MLRLKQIRAEKGLTQEQVAERSGLSRSYICALDSGDREPSVAALRRLADALGVQPGELLTEVPHAS